MRCCKGGSWSVTSIPQGQKDVILREVTALLTTILTPG